MPDVQRDPSLARILVVELAAHVRIGDARQRSRRAIAGGATSDRRHRGHARVGVTLQLDLDALGAERAQEPSAAGRRQEPREVQDADVVQRERLAASRESLVDPSARSHVDHWHVALTREQHGLRVLVQQRGAPADRPRRARRDPFARGIAERAAELRMLDVSTALPCEPVRIHRVFVGLAQRRPEHAGLLGLAPGHVVVGERAHEALHGLHRVVALARHRRGARHEPAAKGHDALLRIEPFRHAVALEQADERLRFARSSAEIGHHPAAVFRVHDGRVRRDRLARVTAGLPEHEHTSHHPRHQVDLGGFRHRLVDRARELLSPPRAPAEQQRGDDGQRELLTGDVEGMPHLRRDRRQVVRAVGSGIVAAVHHHAAESQVDEVRALEVGPRAMVAERRDPRDDQRGMLLHQRAGAEPVSIELTARRRFQHHVGGGDQRAEAITICHLPQVENDRALAAVVLPEEQRALGIFAVLVERPDTARRIAAGRLHLDDVGAQPRQRQPTVLRLLVGQLDDADAGERSAAHFPSSATERIGVPSARMSGRVTDREYHPGIEAE